MTIETNSDQPQRTYEAYVAYRRACRMHRDTTVALEEARKRMNVEIERTGTDALREIVELTDWYCGLSRDERDHLTRRTAVD